MTPVGFEPTIAVGERPLTYALDCAANGIGIMLWLTVGNSLVTQNICRSMRGVVLTDVAIMGFERISGIAVLNIK
jgi:hypothetical protein